MALENIGHALLIVGAIYLHFAYGLDTLITVALCLFALATWTYAGLSDERKALLQAQIQYYHAKAEYFRKKS